MRRRRQRMHRHRECGRAVLCRRRGSTAKSGAVVVRPNVAPPPLQRLIYRGTRHDAINLHRLVRDVVGWWGPDCERVAGGGKIFGRRRWASVENLR